MSARKHIPVSFVMSRLAVNEETLIEMLDLRDGRTPRAQKAAVARICALFGIRKIPGGVWPLKQIERALEEEFKIQNSKLKTGNQTL